MQIFELELLILSNMTPCPFGTLAAGEGEEGTLIQCLLTARLCALCFRCTVSLDLQQPSGVGSVCFLDGETEAEWFNLLGVS